MTLPKQKTRRWGSFPCMDDLQKALYRARIPGSRKMNRLEENFKAGDVVLTPEEVQKIDDKLSTMQFDVFGGHSTK